MTQTRITRCPKCDTSFRVTPSQLQAAKGAVRCGACLHVFRASEHFQQSSKAETKIQDDRTQDMFVDDELFQTQDDASSSPAQSPSVEPSTAISDEDDFLIDDNSGLPDDDHADEPASSFVDYDDEFLSLDSQDHEDPFFSDSGKTHKLEASVKEKDDDDESWAQALLDDADEDEEEEDIFEAKKPAPQKPIKEAASIAAMDKSQFDFIEAAPLELTLPQKKSKAKLWLALGTSFILVLCLLVQMAIFNFDQWARQDAYRPWYQMACAQLQCELPSTYDLSKIRTTASPQVSTHNKFENALTVDVLFMNSAPYAQAFPRLELSFSNKNNQVLAHRLFQPSEYLAGEAAGLSKMPVQTPVHIALEIVDPGPQANSYRVRFLAPQ